MPDGPLKPSDFLAEPKNWPGNAHIENMGRDLMAPVENDEPLGTWQETLPSESVNEGRKLAALEFALGYYRNVVPNDQPSIEVVISTAQKIEEYLSGTSAGGLDPDTVGKTSDVPL